MSQYSSMLYNNDDNSSSSKVVHDDQHRTIKLCKSRLSARRSSEALNCSSQKKKCVCVGERQWGEEGMEIDVQPTPDALERRHRIARDGVWKSIASACMDSRDWVSIHVSAVENGTRGEQVRGFKLRVFDRRYFLSQVTASLFNFRSGSFIFHLYHNNKKVHKNSLMCRFFTLIFYFSPKSVVNGHLRKKTTLGEDITLSPGPKLILFFEYDTCTNHLLDTLGWTAGRKMLFLGTTLESDTVR